MKVLIVTYWSFREPLIQAATLPYLRIIRELQKDDGEIHLLTLEKDVIQLSDAEAEQAKAELAKEGITLVRKRYHKFGLRAMLAWASNLLELIRYCKKHEIDTLHAFGSPAATTAHVISKLTGIQYVIDSYEPHAESMVENGSWRRFSLAYFLLRSFERMQTRRARAVLATTDSMRDYAARKYGRIPGVFVTRPACVDLEQFNPEARYPLMREDLGFDETKIVCVYAGKIGGIYLKQEIFDFFRSCQDHWGSRFSVLMLSDLKKEELERLSAISGFNPDAVCLRFVAHEEVPAYLQLADFAINPVKPVPSKRYCTSIKDGEYWAMGLPVVIPAGISDDSDLIRREEIGVVLDELNSEAYKRAVHELDSMLHDSQGNRHIHGSEQMSVLRNRIRAVAAQHRSMDIARSAYTVLYGSDGVLSKPVRTFLVLIYNSFRDPLFQNLVYEYVREQARRHPHFYFELITFEQRKYAMSRKERERSVARLSGERIYWHPLTYHSGVLMFVKKAIDISAAFFLVARIRIQKRIDMVIAFANTSAAISLLISKWLGTKLMVYSYEPHSEFLAEFGTWKRSGWRYRVLSRLEQKVGREADFILTGTRHMKEILQKQTKAKVFRAPSSVDQDIFKPKSIARESLRKRLGLEGRKVLVYAGKFGGIYYNSEIAAFCHALHALDRAWFFLILTPSPADEVRKIFKRAGLNEVDFHIDEAHGAEEMSRWLSSADMGLTAIPPYPNQKFRSPVKVGEYLMCGLPYITCRGVSEDDEWAELYDVGIVVDGISASSVHAVQRDAERYFSEDRQALRDRCRNTGIAYRGRAAVDDLFEEVLTGV